MLPVILIDESTINNSGHYSYAEGEIPKIQEDFSIKFDLPRDTKLKVLFDEAHGQYYDSSKLKQFLYDIERTFWIEVDINTEQLTKTKLSEYDILILAGLESNLTESEIDAVKNFVSSGGALFISGDWYEYFDPSIYNAITGDFGIYWYDASVKDDTNYDGYNYYPLIHTWSSIDYVNFISNNGSFTVKFSGTCLNITGTVDIVGTGDDDTYAEDPNGNIIASGYDVIVFAALDLDSGGRIFASGSTAFLRSNDAEFYLNYNFDNKLFALNVMEWLINEFTDIFELVRTNVNVTAFCSPDNSYETLKKLILSANESLYIMQYLFTNLYVLDAIKMLKEQKPHVDIKVILEKNQYSGPNQNNIWVADNLSTDIGADVRWDNDTAYDYTHAKMLIIDNKTVMIMTGNWVKTGVPVNNTYGNRECGIIITSPEIAKLFVEIFFDDFEQSSPLSPADRGKEPSRSIQTGDYVPVFTAESWRNITVSALPVVSPESSYRNIFRLIKEAKHFVYIMVPYMTDETLIMKLIDELEKAASRGVTVHVILDNSTSSYSTTKSTLESKGIKVVGINKPFEFVHAKVIIIDDKIVIVSSINWSENSMTDNREAGIAIKSIDVATYYSRIFAHDWLYSGNPFDTDGDGLSDYYEIDHGLNSTNNDTDGDGLSDWEEVVIYESDPLDPNSPGNSPPQIYVISPENNSVLNTSDILVQWEIQDDDGINSSEIKLDDGSWINVGTSTQYTFYDVPDGNHLIYIRATDTLGSFSIIKINITVSAPPEITFNDPIIEESGEYRVYCAFDRIVIGWNASDNSGINYTEIRIDGGAWVNIGKTTNYVISGLSEGEHTLEIKLVDINGNEKIATVSIIIDKTPPTINCEPSYLANTSDVTIKWDGGDNIGLAYYEVKIDGGPWFCTHLNTSITLENVSEGIHTVYIKAVDKAGNYNVTCFVLIVDRTPPDLLMLSPRNLSYVASTRVAIAWDMDDNMGAYASIRVDSGEWIYLGRTSSYELILGEGEHIVEVMVKDIAGNSNVSRIIIYVDVTPPNLAILSPQDGEKVYSNTVTVEWNSTDNFGIAYYLVRVDSDLWMRTTDTNITLTLAAGTHVITIKAVDNAGNTAESSIVITIDPANTNRAQGTDNTCTLNNWQNYEHGNHKCMMNKVLIDTLLLQRKIC